MLQYLFAGSDTSSAYLTVQTISGTTCTCSVNNTCALEGLQLTVHMSGASVASTPVFSPEDIHIITTWGKKNEVNVIGDLRCGD